MIVKVVQVQSRINGTSGSFIIVLAPVFRSSVDADVLSSIAYCYSWCIRATKLDVASNDVNRYLRM